MWNVAKQIMYQNFFDLTKQLTTLADYVLYLNSSLVEGLLDHSFFISPSTS